MKEFSEVICNIEDLKNKELFKSVKYYIIGKTHDQLRKLLAEGGAKESNYLTQLVTLVIADDPNHSEVDEASDVFDLPVVTSRWVLLSAKCGVLLPKSGFQPGVSQLFSGVCACPSQIEPKDQHVLWAMITFFGGKYNLALDNACTHLITTKPSGAKYNHALKVGSNQIKIVTPDWVYESVKGKKRIDEAKCHPRLLAVHTPVSAAPTSTFESRQTQATPSAVEDSPLEGLLLPENVALQLESLLDDVVSGSSIDLPLQSPSGVAHASSRKGSTLLSPTNSNLDSAVKVSTATLAVNTSNESESAPLQMKSSQWMTQQVQGVFNQQQQSLSPASNSSPSFSQSNIGSNTSWVSSVEGQLKDVQISANKVQQVVRIAVPSQFVVRQQQPQQQSILQQSQSQMTWPAHQQQQQQPPQQLQQQQQQQQQPQQQQIQTLRAQVAQQQPPQQLMLRPQGITWSQGQNISNQQLPPRIVQMTPQQRAQVLAMQQQQQASQHQLQQRQGAPMPPAWQRIPPRDSAPQFIGQPQTQMTTMVRPVMVQRAAVPGAAGQQGTAVWYQRGQHPQQIQGPQIQRDGIQLTTQRFSIPVQLQQSNLKDATASHDRQQFHVLQQSQQQQQTFVREANPQQIIVQREGGHPDSVHISQIRSLTPAQHVQIHSSHATNMTQKLVSQNVVSQNMMQVQQQGIQQQSSLSQSLQLKLREAGNVGVTSIPVSTPGTATSNWPPPSPQVRQQQQLQQQAQRQLHPQGLAHLQILQQQQAAQIRAASVSQMRPTLIQQQRSLGPMQGQPLQRAIIPQRVAVTAFANIQRFQSTETPVNPQGQVHPPSGVTVVAAGAGHEQPPAPSPQQPSASPMPVQQQTQTPSPLHQVVQQGQEQIQQQLQNLANLSQPQQVNPKTKTALANLLNNRLHMSPRPNETEMVAQPAVARFPGPVIQHHPPPMGQPPREALPVDHQRTLRNITNSGNTTVMVRAAVGPKQGSPRFTPPSQFSNVQSGVHRVQYFGHELNVKVPPDLCLLGCFFCIVDYDLIIEVAQFKVWIKVIEQYGGEVDTNYGPRITHILCENQRNNIVQQGMREGRRCVTATWLNDVIAAKRMLPPWSPLHYPTQFSDDKPCKNQIISISSFEGDERQRLKRMILLTGAKYTGYFSRSNTLLICRKAEGIKYKSAKEWKIPCVNVEWLQEVLYGHYDALRILMAQKYVQFNSEDPFKVDYLLVPHLMAAWRIPVRITEETWKKHVPNSAALTTLIQERTKRRQEEADRKAKKQRLSPPLEENIPITTRFPPSKENRNVVLFTGIRGTADLSRKVLELGGLIAKNYKECTHLVTDTVCRTVKFMCALNVCKHVVSKSWILESAKENRFIDEKPHILQDPTNENQFGCFIQEIVSRTDRTLIFKDLTFYVTPSVMPSYSLVKEVIESAGGTVVLKCPPFKDIISANKNSTNIVVITCDNDGHLCREMIKKNIGVYNVEFVFTGVMRQELEFKPFLFTTSETTGTKAVCT
ncbi:PAX-interacting protein 1 [Chamberlinius hualienensis]